jgi:hypothetical protein
MQKYLLAISVKNTKKIFLIDGIISNEIMKVQVLKCFI